MAEFFNNMVGIIIEPKDQGEYKLLHRYKISLQALYSFYKSPKPGKIEPFRLLLQKCNSMQAFAVKLVEKDILFTKNGDQIILIGIDSNKLDAFIAKKFGKSI